MFKMGEVLPTRVGMVRWNPIGFSTKHCSPHARGDGPIFSFGLGKGRKFSPRAWGWSGLMRVCPYCREVLPTRVGMVRNRLRD